MSENIGFRDKIYKCGRVMVKIYFEKNIMILMWTCPKGSEICFGQYVNLRKIILNEIICGKGMLGFIIITICKRDEMLKDERRLINYIHL